MKNTTVQYLFPQPVRLKSTHYTVEVNRNRTYIKSPRWFSLLFTSVSVGLHLQLGKEHTHISLKTTLLTHRQRDTRFLLFLGSDLNSSRKVAGRPIPWHFGLNPTGILLQRLPCAFHPLLSLHFFLLNIVSSIWKVLMRNGLILGEIFPNWFIYKTYST